MSSTVKTHMDLPADPMEFALQIVGWASTIMQPDMDEVEAEKIAKIIVERMSDTAMVFDTLRSIIESDKSYAHTWHCNLAMAFSDVLDSGDDTSGHWLERVRNEGATSFMKICFGVETSNDMLTKSEIKK